MPISARCKADLSGWDMQGWELHSSEPIRPRMNWKLVIDTFLELYHFRYLHPGTVFPLFLDNIATYERMDRHIRIGGRQAHAHRARGPAARRAGASSTTPSCSISSSPTRC